MWLRRLITRMLAVLPAFFVIYFKGEGSAGSLLVLSQVVLSIQLGFAVIPLIHFVSDRKKMAAFTIRNYTKLIAWLIAAIIISFNIKLIMDTLSDWFASMPHEQVWLKYLVIAVAAFSAIVLVFITFEPFNRIVKYKTIKKARQLHPLPLGSLSPIPYRKIAITVDFSETDYLAINKAVAQGGKNAQYVLINVIETANALLSESEVADMQTGTNTEQLRHYTEEMTAQGFNAGYMIGYGRRSHAIAKMVHESGAELLVMGEHGHRGVKDLIFGETINSVRHKITIPLLAVK
jgi:manganese transport protein